MKEEKCEKILKKLNESDTVKKLKEIIKAQYWYPTHREGNTGIGKTLEDLLGISENKNSKGDIEIIGMEPVELKSSRIGTQSMITLFTKSPEPRGKGNKRLLEDFGYYNDNSEFKELHCTLSIGSNKIKGKQLLMEINKYGNDKRIELINEKRNNGREVVAYYSKEELEKAAMKKLLTGLVLVEADTKIEDSTEKFRYINAIFLCDFNVDKLFEIIKQGDLLLDLRIGTYKSGKNKGKPHDHGNGFRAFDRNLKNIFNKKFSIIV